MHHIKHIRKSNFKVKNYIQILSKLSRKQISVCRVCHNKIHKGEYDGVNLKNLNKSK